MTTTNDDNAIRDWIERVESALPAPSGTEVETRQPYTLVVSRKHEYWTFTMVVNASDPVTAARHATTALQATPIPQGFDGVGPFEVVDIYKGDVDLNEIEAGAGSLAHLLPYE